mgnify:FL=1
MIQQIYKKVRENQTDLVTIQSAIYHNLYSELSTLNIPNEVISMTVGKEGCNFIKKTEANNLFSIWCNRERNVIEFWGVNPINRQRAMGAILNNLIYNTSKFQASLKKEKKV